MFGVLLPVTRTDDVAETAPPLDCALTLAVLSIRPLRTSCCVVVYVAEHVIVAAGATVVPGHEIADSPGSGSVTVTAVSVSLPVFDTVNAYVMTSPAVVNVVG